LVGFVAFVKVITFDKAIATLESSVEQEGYAYRNMSGVQITKGLVGSGAVSYAIIGGDSQVGPCKERRVKYTKDREKSPL
jgi:hypothetical protein